MCCTSQSRLCISSVFDLIRIRFTAQQVYKEFPLVFWCKTINQNRIELTKYNFLEKAKYRHFVLIWYESPCYYSNKMAE